MKGIPDSVRKHEKKSKIMEKYKWYTTARFIKCKAVNGKRQKPD